MEATVEKTAKKYGLTREIAGGVLILLGILLLVRLMTLETLTGVAAIVWGAMMIAERL
jgi:uncharacterized membrane protein HdeD (DUF308 family)